MEITKYQDLYEKILDKLGNMEIRISRSDAYYLCKYNNLMHTYPFPEDVNFWGELHEKKYSEEEIAELVKKRDAEISAAHNNKKDNTGDFNIFNLKYYNQSKYSGNFKIPLVDIAKNYFLCYQQNIDNFRRGLKSLDTISTMQIYEHVLQSTRQSVVEVLAREVGLSLEMAGGLDAFDGDYDTYADLDKAKEHAVEAKNVIDILKENETKSADYKNTREGSGYSIFGADFMYFNFSKQMFVDLIETKYKNNPIVKKAVSVYIESQSDESLMAQMKNIYQNYAADDERRQDNHDRLRLRNGRYTLEGAIADLLK